MSEHPYRQPADIEKYIEVDVGKMLISVSVRGLTEVGSSVYKMEKIGKYHMRNGIPFTFLFSAHEFLTKIKESGFCAIEQGNNEAIAVPLHRIVDIKFKQESHKIKIKEIAYANWQADVDNHGKDNDDR